MRKMKRLLCLLLIAALLVGFSGCYVIRGQKMNRLKGTYKLTYYTYTPSYDIGSEPPETRDYVNGEKYLWEDYLVITGTDMGYYIHKDVNTPAYVKEVKLTYEYDTEDSSKIDYVTFMDVLTTTAEPGVNRLGVNGKRLNYSKSSVTWNGFLIKQHTEAIHVTWEKVDDATDLSYAKAQLGSIKEYTYGAFGVRGVYEMISAKNAETGEYLESEYQYFFYVIDTAKGVRNARVYYALKEAPTQHEVRNYIISCSEDWNTITVANRQWNILDGSGRYTNEENGVQYEIVKVSSDISDHTVQQLIKNRLPAIEPPVTAE